MSDDARKIVHRYEIVERLGQGGMGDLYLGRDPMLDRFVAIKMLKAGTGGDDLRERFAREARSAARLAHINIVTIYDVGEHEGQPYIAMEYVVGETLLEKIRRRSELPLSTKLQYIDELCAGLAFAHRSGIVHRDIKPANLIVATEGALKILDFGIARLADSSMTQSGMMLGTLNYMSPEQIAGPDLDHRSDIFAVGAVFYELLSYQQAFPGAIDTVLSRILYGTPVPILDLCPGLDATIVQIIEKALAKSRDDRFEDLTAMRSELARARERMDRGVLESPVTTLRSSGSKSPVALPTPGHKTPRRGTTREEIRRRRAEEVAGHLAAARNALAAGRFEEASAACERVLIIDADNDEALDLSERSRSAIEANQIRMWASEARAELERGNLEGAQGLLSSIVALDADSPDAKALRAAIAQIESRRLADRTVVDGRQALDNGDAAAAAGAAREALRVQPTHTGALSLLREAGRLVDAQHRKADHDRQAHDAINLARRSFAQGDMDAALEALQQFSPPHPDVVAAIDQLRAERDEIREREWALEQQAAAEIVIARAWLARDDLDEATAAVDRARMVAPNHADIDGVADAIETRRAEIEARRRADEEARRQAELARLRAEEDARRKAQEQSRRKAEEAARKKAEEEARRKTEEDARMAAAEQARIEAEAQARRDAAEAEAQRLAEAERKAEAEAEAARRKAEAEAEARRKAQAEAERKAEAQRQAQAEVERKAEAQRQAQAEVERKAELEARRKAESEAQRKVQDDEARRVAAEEAQRKEEKRKAEEARRQAAAEARRKEEEDARRKAADEARRQAEDARRTAEEKARQKAAAAAQAQADEQARQAEAKRKAEDEARRRAEKASAAGPQQASSAQTIVTRRPPQPALDPVPDKLASIPLVSPVPAAPRAGAGPTKVLPLAAAAVLVVGLVGFGMWSFSGSDDPPAPALPMPDAPVEQPPASSAAPSTDAKPPAAAEIPPATGPAASPGTPEVQIESLRRQARLLMQRNESLQALESAEKGLQLSPADAQLLQMVASMERAALDAAGRAKDAAVKAGAQKSADALFTDGTRKEAEAAAKARTRDRGGNIRSLWAAAESFGQAASQARAVTERAAIEDAARLREAEDKRIAELARAKEQAEAQARQAEIERKQKEQSRVSDAPPAALPPKVAAPGPAVPAGASDEEAVRETLRQYEAAYESLNVAAVAKVYPSVRADQLAAAFRQYRSYDLEIMVQNIQFAPTRTSATVQARVTYEFQPQSGRRVSSTVAQRFTLQKDGATWRIDGIR